MLIATSKVHGIHFMVFAFKLYGQTTQRLSCKPLLTSGFYLQCSNHVAKLSESNHEIIIGAISSHYKHVQTISDGCNAQPFAKCLSQMKNSWFRT